MAFWGGKQIGVQLVVHGLAAPDTGGEVLRQFTHFRTSFSSFGGGARPPHPRRTSPLLCSAGLASLLRLRSLGRTFTGQTSTKATKSGATRANEEGKIRFQFIRRRADPRRADPPETRMLWYYQQPTGVKRATLLPRFFSLPMLLLI